MTTLPEHLQPERATRAGSAPKLKAAARPRRPSASTGGNLDAQRRAREGRQDDLTGTGGDGPPAPLKMTAPPVGAASRLPEAGAAPTPLKSVPPAPGGGGGPTPLKSVPPAPGGGGGPTPLKSVPPAPPGGTGPSSPEPGGGHPVPVPGGEPPVAGGEPPAPVAAKSVEPPPPSHAVATRTPGAVPSPVVAGLAAHHTAFLSVDAALTTADVLVHGAQQQARVAAYFATRVAALNVITSTAIGRLMAAQAFVGAFLANHVTARALALQAAILGAFASAVAVGERVQTAVVAGVDAVTGTVRDVVSTVLDGVDAVVARVPIPDVPGAARVRRFLGDAVRAVRATVSPVVEGVLAAATGLVQRVLGLVQRAVQTLRAAVTQVVTQVVGWVVGLVARLQARLAGGIARVVALVGHVAATVRGVLTSVRRAVQRHVAALVSASVGRIMATNLRAARAIADLREASAEVPPERGGPAPDPARRAVRDAELISLMDAVHERGRAENRRTVWALRLRTASLVTSALFLLAETVVRLRDAVAQALETALGTLRSAAADIVDQVRQVLAKVRGLVDQLIDRIVGGLAGLVERGIAWVGARVRSFLAFVRGLPARAAAFLRGLVSAVVRALASGSLPRLDTSPLTAGARAYSPTTLNASAAAAFAAPVALPALGAVAELLAAIAAVIAGVELAVLLWWVGLILLVIAIIVLLVLAFRALTDEQIEERVRERPEPTGQEEPEPRQPRKRPDDPPPPPPPGPPEERRRRKPFFWDPKPQVARAAHRGAVDARLQAPRMHYEAHHCWPEYVGGAPDQPLMGARVSVHNYIHGGSGTGTLHDAMAVAAASEGFQLHRDTVKNQPFIARMRTSKQARDTFSAALFAYYGVALNAQTDPLVPPPAYAPGIAFAYARVAR